VCVDEPYETTSMSASHRLIVLNLSTDNKSTSV
jgi:hypothetical protein